MSAATEQPAPAASPQQQAVRNRAGHPTVLVAAAGSGKTRVLTWLYTDAHLAEGIAIERLLAITFTNRAAGELRERIAGVLQGTALGRDPDLTEAWIGTFHGIAARLLREFAHRRGLDPGFSVIDELTAAELQAKAWEDALGLILDEHGHDAADLIAQVGEGPLRAAVLSWWTARRSAGEVHPALPTPTTGDEDVRGAVRALRRAGEGLAAAADELRNPARPSKRLAETIEIVDEVLAAADGIERLVDHPPVHAREAARAVSRLEARTPHRGAPLGKEHPALVDFLDARATLARRLGELVAGPRVATVAHLARAFSEAYERRKRGDECLDHDDLELEALELLRREPAVRAQLAQRFARIFVDEFQDTSPRQAELVELLTGDRPWAQVAPGDGLPAVTVVGDPRQAIYGFRYASVDLIRDAERHAPAGVALQLSANYRSDAEVLGAIDRAFSRLDPDHQPVDAQRGPEPLPGGEARVEVLITRDDRADPWDGEALGGRPGEEPGAVLAEARLVAARIAELRAAEPARSIAVLARARRSLIPIAEALGALGIEAVQDGAEGFWERLEVADLVAWLRLVRNPRDDAALLAVLASPLVGCSIEALAHAGDLADLGNAGARLAALIDAARDGRLSADDARRIEALAELLGRQREPGRDADPCALLDEVIAATGYDEHLAALQGGGRRLANVARLRRLATDEMASGGDVGSLVDRAASEQRHGLRAPEAALGGTGAVQLMTIHQSKGLEFDTVVVAGLGSQGRSTAPALLGDDTRLGLRLRPAPGAAAQPLFEHAALAAELARREQEELRRVLYVALTRARERLLVSGVVTWRKDGAPFGREIRDSTPVIEWLAPALIPELPAIVEAACEGPRRTAEGLRLCVSAASGDTLAAGARNPRRAELPEHRTAGPDPAAFDPLPIAPLPAPPVLSYTALSRHAACGLRFYAEEVLRLPDTPAVAVAADPSAAQGLPVAEASTGRRRRGAPVEGQLSLFGEAAPSASAEPTLTSPEAAPTLAANVLGTIVHAVLERAPADLAGDDVGAAILTEAAAANVLPEPADLVRMRELVDAALAAPVWRELWAGGRPPLRERAFTIAVGAEGHVLTGVVDAQSSEPDGTVLVVDYKTDRLEAGVDLGQHVAERYALQRAAYALAALRSGAAAVRVVHLFLDGGRARQAELRAVPADADDLERQLVREVRVVASGEAGVTPAPDAVICDGCPARGSICRWPVAVTAREPGAGLADPSRWQGDPAALRPY